jgi:hypothetical protein
MSEVKRISVPLVMIEGNIDILLENRIPVEAVSLCRDEDSENGVVLIMHGLDREVAEELGFKTERKITK